MDTLNLHFSTSACIYQSHFFPLSRGTRQGCPISPLLFAIVIEPLSIALKANKLFTGIERHGVEHKVSLYADDLLLFISDPIKSIPCILTTLESFGNFSGYKLNVQKSECFPVNQLAKMIPQNRIPFKLSIRFKYLGIIITSSIASLREENLTALTAKVKNDLHRWNTLPLSLVSRVQSIKMNILPRYSYLFQCLPIFLPKQFFRQLDSIILNFIWNGKTPRACKPLLQRERSKGVLGLLNFQFYYWAANMYKVALWLSDTEDSWLQLESNSCHSSSLKAIVCSSLPIKPRQYSSNPLVISTLKIWQQIRHHFDWTSWSLATPLCNNQQFKPGKTDGRFSIWATQGLSCLGDFYIDGTFASFTQLRSTFRLQHSDLFRYFQIRNFARHNTFSFPQIPSASGTDHILPVTRLSNGHISFLYNLVSTATPPALHKIKVGWETELGISMSDTFWDAALKTVNSSSSCARLGLIQFKVLHRIH